ncbi:MAG TPA: alpha/beta hydrolase [Stackebrandtia sp.]|jgi:pimeloyl-ACP methyl ester carboxylesterase|uniref:alpha/beta fold hydrolase n=1 Tax=Stackebrandtia sp. TaxID=2023065 RepID=UPI002D5739AE|nr:alpha/beta hydrolase [Stackebrandtia sp.]HZE37616.1 alpha/beta hydrolase [Stackebrandtia sp.]
MNTQTLTLPEGTIAYELTGPADGPLVVCAPGMGVTRSTFRYLAPTLADAGYRVATMDVRGHGESSLGWNEYSPTAVSHDVEALVRELGGPAVVIGHSFAAKSVSQLASREPGLVSAMVIVGPAVEHSKPGAFLGTAAKMITGNASLWTMYVKSLYPGDKPADFAEDMAALKASLSRKGGAKPVRALLDSFPEDPKVDLSTVTAPTLIVMGTKDGDHSDPTAEAHRIASELGGPTTVELSEGSGHYPHVDNAKTVGPVVVGFLNGLKEN